MPTKQTLILESLGLNLPVLMAEQVSSHSRQPVHFSIRTPICLSTIKPPLLMSSQKGIARHPLWPAEYVLASFVHKDPGLSAAEPVVSSGVHRPSFFQHRDIGGYFSEIGAHIFSCQPSNGGAASFPPPFHEAYRGILYSI